ncbi:MAG: hypothetical protein ACI4DY_14570 [Monoglobaceae bacterium]
MKSTHRVRRKVQSRTVTGQPGSLKSSIPKKAVAKLIKELGNNRQGQRKGNSCKDG